MKTDNDMNPFDEGMGFGFIIGVSLMAILDLAIYIL